MQYPHLAIDIGSESGRAIVGYLENNEIKIQEIYRFKTQDLFLNKRLVRNVYRYYEEIIKTLGIYVKEFGPKLSSIGVDAWGSDFALLDEDNQLMFLPNSYRDGFSRNMHLIVEEKIGIDRVYDLTGNQMMLSDTLHQLIALKKNGFDLTRAKSIVSIADLFHYFLCGAINYEHSLASYCRLFDNNKQDWADDIFEALDIPKGLITRISHSTEKVGILYKEICDISGLENEVDVITPSAHDTACAAFAVPDLKNDWGFISSGTWSLVGMETTKPVINEISKKYNVSNSGLPFGKNMFKRCVAGMWLIHQCMLLWEKYNYSEITRLAEEVKHNHIYIDTDYSGFYSPKNMLTAIYDYIAEKYGIEIEVQNAGIVARIIFESLALKYRYIFDYLVEASGKQIHRIYILGGGSKNELLDQLTANATKMNVYIGMEEATSVGNIMLQIYGKGKIDSEKSIKEVLINTFPQKCFQPHDSDEWEAKYAAWKEFYLTNQEKDFWV
jgi:rhamnulokinase